MSEAECLAPNGFAIVLPAGLMPLAFRPSPRRVGPTQSDEIYRRDLLAANLCNFRECGCVLLCKQTTSTIDAIRSVLQCKVDTASGSSEPGKKDELFRIGRPA